MADRLLDAAETLLNSEERSSAFKRRAVSTAYYAVFHALAKACANTLLPNDNYDSPDYERVYRTLDHGPLRDAFSKGPLKEVDSLRKIGELVVRLQNERKRADYLPPLRNVFSSHQARGLLSQARQAVEAINTLGEEDRKTLAVWLLFKTGRGQ